MKKKGKKKGGSTFKASAVTNDEDAQKIQLQMNKKLYQDQYIIKKTSADAAVKKWTEARKCFNEVRQFQINEIDKYKSIDSDFKHQTSLMETIFLQKKSELEGIIEDRDKTLQDWKEKENQMIAEHKKKMEEKRKMWETIRGQMEELSSKFSEQLSEIQGELVKQTKHFSEKWERNPSEQTKQFDKELAECHVVDQGEKKE